MPKWRFMASLMRVNWPHLLQPVWFFRPTWMDPPGRLARLVAFIIRFLFDKSKLSGSV